MIRVLHSVSNMDRAGIETMLMNYYRHMDRDGKYSSIFCVIRKNRVRMMRKSFLWVEEYFIHQA